MADRIPSPEATSPAGPEQAPGGEPQPPGVRPASPGTPSSRAAEVPRALPVAPDATGPREAAGPLVGTVVAVEPGPLGTGDSTEDDASAPRGAQPLAAAGRPGGSVPLSGSEASGGSGERKRTHYKILRELGRGGMGVVYHALQIERNREVALKLIRSDLLRKEKTRKRFQREVRALARLQHPNLVNFFDYKLDGEHHYLAMEYVDGNDLQTYLQKSPLPTREFLLLLARDIAAAMQYFHARGIIHRDMKPRNILLTSDLRAKVSDFGLAKHLDLSAITAVGNHVGTPRYMAPEVAQNGVVDQRSDLFQLGLILYEVATSKPAHRGDTVRDVIESCITGRIVPPCELNPTLDEDVQAFIMRLLALRPTDRYQHAGDVLRALDELEREGRLRERKARRSGSPSGGEAVERRVEPPAAEGRRPGTGTTGRGAVPRRGGSMGAETALLGVVEGGRRPSTPGTTVLLGAAAVVSLLLLPLAWAVFPRHERPAYDVFAPAGRSEGSTTLVTWRSTVPYQDRLTYRREDDRIEVTVGDPQGAAVTEHRVALRGLVPGASYRCRANFPDGRRSDEFVVVAPAAASGAEAPSPWTSGTAGGAGPESPGRRGPEGPVALADQVRKAMAALSGDAGGAERTRSAALLMSLTGDASYGAVLPHLRSANRIEREWAVRVLGRVDPERALPDVLPLLADGFSSVRDAAAVAASRATARRCVALIARHCASPRAEVRRAAALALSGLPGAEPLDALLSLAGDADRSVRRAALLGLGRPAAARCVSVLVAALAGAALERPAVLRALGRVGDPVAVPAVKAWLGSPDPLTRTAALVALARLESAQAVQLLERDLRSASPAASASAASALGATGRPEAGDMLAAWLERGVGGEARRRAIRSAGRLPGERARAAVLTLAHAPLPLDRADALLALGEGGRAEDAPAVAAGLSDEAPAVRAAACLALSWCGRGPAAGVLEAHMAGERSPDVRDAALFALSRLRGADLLLGAPPEALSVDANGVVKVSAEEEG